MGSGLLSDIDDFVIPAAKAAMDQEDLRAYLATHVYSDDLKIPDDEPVLFYEGNLIGSRGNILCINGRAKSRKSVIASAMMSAAFSNGFLGFTCTLPAKCKVLNFDTEQGYGDWLDGSRRVIKDAGLQRKPEGFISHYSRDATVEFRLELLLYAMELYDPDVLILDGVTDLVYDLNSQAEATTIGNILMNLSVKYNCLVVAVIHVTKGHGYMTGALGTFLEKKCQTAIKCEKPEEDESISHISCQYARRRPFEAFAITFDNEAGHYRRLDKDERDVLDKVYGPQTKSHEYARQFFDAIFRINSSYKTEKEFKAGIKKTGETLGMPGMPNEDIKAWINAFQLNGWLKVDGNFEVQRAENLTLLRTQNPELPLVPAAHGRPNKNDPNPADDLPF